MKIKFTQALSLAICSAFLVSCGGGNTSETTEKPVTEEAEEMSAPEISTTVEIKEGQNVFFKNLENGQEITLPFVMEFGVEGMEVEPAGVVRTDMGHHHLIVDAGHIPAGQMVPMDETNKHFGKGELTDTLNIEKYPTLTPGDHTLTMQFGDGIHTSYGEKMSATVTVTVK